MGLIKFDERTEKDLKLERIELGCGKIAGVSNRVKELSCFHILEMKERSF